MPPALPVVGDFAFVLSPRWGEVGVRGHEIRDFFLSRSKMATKLSPWKRPILPFEPWIPIDITAKLLLVACPVHAFMKVEMDRPVKVPQSDRIERVTVHEIHRRIDAKGSLSLRSVGSDG